VQLVREAQDAILHMLTVNPLDRPSMKDIVQIFSESFANPERTLVLFGCLESGKSTLMKQIKINFNGGFSSASATPAPAPHTAAPPTAVATASSATSSSSSVKPVSPSQLQSQQDEFMAYREIVRTNVLQAIHAIIMATQKFSVIIPYRYSDVCS